MYRESLWVQPTENLLKVREKPEYERNFQKAKTKAEALGLREELISPNRLKMKVSETCRTCEDEIRKEDFYDIPEERALV